MYGDDQGPSQALGRGALRNPHLLAGLGDPVSGLLETFSVYMGCRDIYIYRYIYILYRYNPYRPRKGPLKRFRI